MRTAAPSSSVARIRRRLPRAFVVSTIILHHATCGPLPLLQLRSPPPPSSPPATQNDVNFGRKGLPTSFLFLSLLLSLVWRLGGFRHTAVVRFARSKSRWSTTAPQLSLLRERLGRESESENMRSCR